MGIKITENDHPCYFCVEELLPAKIEEVRKSWGWSETHINMSVVAHQKLKLLPELSKNTMVFHVHRDGYELSICKKHMSELFREHYDTVIEQNPIIWGDGWYAILDDDYEGDDTHAIWFVAPKKFFDENGHCPDGWEWDIPEGMDSDDLDEFIDEHGCGPTPPKEFGYCIESGFSCSKDIPLEEQKKMIREAGFMVDNVPDWYWNR